jgi:pimeloyl-ACP methyl ester carboxylesterase
LERAGHRVIAYDARGHGESDPAPAAEGYGYPWLVADLERVVATAIGAERFVLAGHSMGAHTAVAYALRHPGRLTGLVVIGPVYLGETPPSSLAYWDGLAAALEQGGVDGFLAYIDRNQGIDSAWRDSVLGFTRARMQLHRHPRALATGLREVPRSRPFESLAQLESLDIPALVVASHDDADPGHPYATAAAYAERLPRARLLSEREGQSPLAWQGGRLSRELAAFYSEALSSSL